MSWQPEDWQFQRRPAGASTRGVVPHLHAVRRLLHDIPAASGAALLELTGKKDHAAPLPAGQFDRVVRVTLGDLAAHTRGQRFEVAVASEALVGLSRQRLTAALSGLHDCLAEAGLLVASLEGQGSRRDTIALGIAGLSGLSRDDEARLHPFELQYRLRAVGFQGVRIRATIDDDAGHRLVCRAVRRAMN